MTVRKRYEQELKNLRQQVAEMAHLVEGEFRLALQALELWDMHLAGHVLATEHKVNTIRFDIEKASFKLISTQQPLAGDLRIVVAVLNIIVDLERIGDAAQNIVEAIPDLRQTAKYERPTDLVNMGEKVHIMFQHCMEAFTKHDSHLAAQIAAQENEIDVAFAKIQHRLIEELTKTNEEKNTAAVVGLLRAAKQLERTGDLITNIAERILYMETGTMRELNPDSE